MKNALVKQDLDGIAFELAEATDLTFIQRYGRVFRIFDDHDSGNISFSVDAGENNLFIKLAGVATKDAAVTKELAIANMRLAEKIYRDLAHPNVVQMLDRIEHPHFFGLVFAWDSGTLLRRVNEADFGRFRALDESTRLRAFASVLEIFQHIHRCGYVAIDIYDASFLYDFDHERLTICDLDVCERKPLVNSMGRMWGSSRFMAPEEYELGAEIDEITNVFTLGAIAHLFFGDERTRDRNDWEASPELFDIAQRATLPDRSGRYQSITAFREAWNLAAVQDS